LTKVVFVDWSVFVHRSIFAWRTSPNKQIRPTFTAMAMILGSLMRVGITPDDIIIIACDSPKGNWRKDIDPAYKANRKEKRDSFEELNWDDLFFQFNQLAQKVDAATPWHFVEVDRHEADDIIAYGVKHFSENECVIISTDSDFEMLTAYKNVKLYSPTLKSYKHVKNPYKIIAKKIKREATDNLITPIITAADYEKRNKIVNLVQLPSIVEENVAEALSQITEKEYDVNLLGNPTLIERFNKLYNSDKVVNPDAKHRAKRKKSKK
jgi:5'-3' exonuclease